MRASNFVARLSAAALAALLVPMIAGAQSSEADERLRDQLKRTVIQMREAQDENAAIKAKQADDDKHTQDLQTQLDQAKQQLADAQGKSKGSEDAKAALAAAQTQAKAAEDQQQQLQSALTKWQDAYKQAADVARQRDADAKTLAASGDDLQRKLTDCRGKNFELYSVGTDILSHYENIDIGELMARKEVFTQIARVKLENAVQDYQDKLRDQKMPAAPPATVTPAAAPTPAIPPPPSGTTKP